MSYETFLFILALCTIVAFFAFLPRLLQKRLHFQKKQSQRNNLKHATAFTIELLKELAEDASWSELISDSINPEAEAYSLIPEEANLHKHALLILSGEARLMKKEGASTEEICAHLSNPQNWENAKARVKEQELRKLARPN